MDTVATFIYNARSLLINIIFMVIPNPYMLAIAAVIFCIYVGVQRLYIASSRQLRRLELASKSPIYNLVSEVCTPSGLATIRAFRSGTHFAQICTNRLNESQRPYATLWAVRSWLQLCMNLVAMALTVSLVALAVALRRTSSVGVFAVALSGAASLTNLLNATLITTTELEMTAVAIERIREFSELKAEGRSAQANSSETLQDGTISFHKVSATYPGSEHLILKNLSLDIKSGERIGVCGRTGAGKSSLLLSIFGSLDLEAGSELKIGGRDVTEWDPRSLRSQLSIIPQNAVILAAAVRVNLDPEGICDEVRIWDALQRCGVSRCVMVRLSSA